MMISFNSIRNEIIEKAEKAGADIISPYPAPTVEAAIAYLDTPLRVIIELVPEKVIRFDGDRIAKASHEGTVPGA